MSDVGAEIKGWILHYALKQRYMNIAQGMSGSLFYYLTFKPLYLLLFKSPQVLPEGNIGIGLACLSICQSDAIPQKWLVEMLSLFI